MVSNNITLEVADAGAAEYDKAQSVEANDEASSFLRDAAFESGRSKASLPTSAIRSRRVKQAPPQYSRRALLALIVLATILAIITQSLLSLKQQGLASITSSVVSSLGKILGRIDTNDEKLRQKAKKAYYKRLQLQKGGAEAAAKNLLWEVLSEQVVMVLNIHDSSSNMKAALRAVAVEEERLSSLSTADAAEKVDEREGGSLATESDGVQPSHPGPTKEAHKLEQSQLREAEEELSPQAIKQQRREEAQRLLKERERKAEEQARLKLIEIEKLDKAAEEREDAAERLLQTFQDFLVLETMAELDAADDLEFDLDDEESDDVQSEGDTARESAAYEPDSDKEIAAKSLWASLLQINLNPELMARRQIDSDGVFEQLEGLLRRAWLPAALEGGEPAVENLQHTVAKLRQDDLGAKDSRRVLAGKLVLELQMAKHMSLIANLVGTARNNHDKTSQGEGPANTATEETGEPEEPTAHRTSLDTKTSIPPGTDRANHAKSVRSMVWAIRAVNAQAKILSYWLLSELSREVCLCAPHALRAPTARASFLLQRYYKLVAEGALYSLPYMFHSAEQLERRHPQAVSHLRFVKSDIMSTLTQLEEEIGRLSGAAEKGPWGDWLPNALRPLKAHMWFYDSAEGGANVIVGRTPTN